MIARPLIATLIAVGLVLSAQSARADAARGAGAPSAPTCSVSLDPSGQGVTLPSNAPALLVVDSSSSGLTATVTGELVSGSTRTTLVAPAKDAHGLLTMALPTKTAGAHTLELVVSCSNEDAEKTLKTPLTLTAPVAFPTEVGALVHVPQNPPTGVDTIAFEPTPSMRAFLPAALVELSVDGNTVQKSYAPRPSDSPIKFSAHTGDVCIENGVLHRDKRVVRVALSAVIAGVAETPTSTTLDVPVDCGAIKWTSGGGPGGAKTPTTSSPGASGESSGVDGCTAAHRASGSNHAFLTIGLASLVFALRRRRRS